MTEITQLKADILKLADHCVKCGLCSSQCPTYGLAQDENESPRGRISLAQAIASDAIQIGTMGRKHLENCLQCRRCEVLCPSKVEYGKLIKHTNLLIQTSAPKNTLSKTFLIKRISRITEAQWRLIRSVYSIFSRLKLTKILLLTKTGRTMFRLLPKYTKQELPDIKLNKQNQKNRNCKLIHWLFKPFTGF